MIAITFLWLLPRNVCVLILKAYRAVISPLYGDVCRYYPSCSSYALQAIQRYGVVVGISLGLLRIVRCNPWAAGGVDDVPQRRIKRYALTPAGFVAASRVHSNLPSKDLHTKVVTLTHDPRCVQVSHSHGKG